jgi:hypothetical protein
LPFESTARILAPALQECFANGTMPWLEQAPAILHSHAFEEGTFVDVDLPV